MKYPFIRDVLGISPYYLFDYHLFLFRRQAQDVVLVVGGRRGEKTCGRRERAERRFKENVNELLLFGTTNHVIFVHVYCRN